MQEGSGTRSSLLWEVERLLQECDEKPQVLLMENVSQVHGVNNAEMFKQFQFRLEKLGYQSYWQDLLATDYGIPQTRNRTFMISILGDYNFKFPKKVKLNLRLNDIKENEQNVDESFYLTKKMLNYITADNEKWSGNNGESLINKSIASTINTREGNRRCDASNYVSENLPQDLDLKLYIKNADKTGYLVAHEGDGVDVSSRMEHHRGNVKKGLSQTITTFGENNGIVVKLKRGYDIKVKREREKESCEVDYLGSYSKSNFNQTAIVGKNGCAPTFTENHGQITAIVVEKGKK